MTATFDPYHAWLGIPPKDQPPNHYRLLGIELFEQDTEVIIVIEIKGIAIIKFIQVIFRFGIFWKRLDFGVEIPQQIIPIVHFGVLLRDNI